MSPDQKNEIFEVILSAQREYQHGYGLHKASMDGNHLAPLLIESYHQYLLNEAPELVHLMLGIADRQLGELDTLHNSIQELKQGISDGTLSPEKIETELSRITEEVVRLSPPNLFPGDNQEY